MATSIDGKTLTSATEATVLGRVTSISGTGSKATVTIVDFSGNSFTCPASDVVAPETEGPAVGANGKSFSVNDQVNVPVTVLSVMGTGGAATLSVQTRSVSQASSSVAPVKTSVTVAATSVRAPHK
jgi:hypothetical protein